MSDTINRISNNQKLNTRYLYKQNSSEIFIDDHYKYIFLYYSRIYLMDDNDGKLIKLIISYFNLKEDQIISRSTKLIMIIMYILVFFVLDHQISVI